jgi:hypothetical protein
MKALWISLAAVGGIALAGCWYVASQSRLPIPRTVVPSMSSTTSASATSSPTATADDCLSLNILAGVSTPTSATGYIKRIYSQDNRLYMEIDYVDWLTENTNTCTNNDGTSPGGVVPGTIPMCGPDGFLVVNQDPQIRTLEILPQGPVCLLTATSSVDGGNVEPQPFTLSQLAECLAASERAAPSGSTANASSLYNGGDCAHSLYDITLKGGIVTAIEEQLQP